MNLTLIIPIHNEELVLRDNALKLHAYMKTLKSLGSFEILLVLNGCTDGSEDIAMGINRTHPEIRHMTIGSRGLGKAIREGAVKALYEPMMFYAIDLPFGLAVIGDSLREAQRRPEAVIIGSKGHRDSDVRRGLMRTVFSATISTLNNILFGLNVRDTQGSILFYREPLRRYGALMDSPGPFFQTQLLIYSVLSGFRLIEIPVAMAGDVRKTRFRLASDGLKYLYSIFRERLKLLKRQKGQNGG